MSRLLSIIGVVLLAIAASGAYFWFQAEPTADAAMAEQEQELVPDLAGRQGPEQPIDFWHSVHAGQNQIPCMYCHYTADRSPSAGIPSVKLCVGCHVPGSGSIAPEQAQLGFPSAERNPYWNQEATKLVEAWQQTETIPWVKIHDLPEHVRFPHMSHVRVGVQCQSCHGPVEEMERVYQFSSLQMGWCIDCHSGKTELSEQEDATIRERSTYVRTIAAAAASNADVQGALGTHPRQRASIDCSVCHY